MLMCSNFYLGDVGLSMVAIGSSRAAYSESLNSSSNVSSKRLTKASSFSWASRLLVSKTSLSSSTSAENAGMTSLSSGMVSGFV